MLQICLEDLLPGSKSLAEYMGHLGLSRTYSNPFLATLWVTFYLRQFAIQDYIGFLEKIGYSYQAAMDCWTGKGASLRITARVVQHGR